MRARMLDPVAPVVSGNGLLVTDPKISCWVLPYSSIVDLSPLWYLWLSQGKLSPTLNMPLKEDNPENTLRL